MRRLGIVAAAALLAGCGANQPASCAPCPGPGFVASGIPQTIDHGTTRVCVADMPCTRTRFDHRLEPGSQQFVQLEYDGRTFEDYDGTPIQVTVMSGGHRWQGSGAFDYTYGGPGTCTCSYLVAEIAFTELG